MHDSHLLAVLRQHTSSDIQILKMCFVLYRIVQNLHVYCTPIICGT